MSSKTKLWYLENFNLFEVLSQEDKMKMADQIIDSTVGKGEYIYFPEDPSTTLFILKEGRVKIGSFSDDGKEIIKTILSPGEIFGELALVGEETRNDFAIALEADTVVCAISLDDMMKAMEGNPRLNLQITKLIGLRLRKVERRLESLVFKDARARIIEFIKDIAKEQGKKIGDEVLVKHHLTHQEIANITATSRQTVTTVLNELREQDQIYLERNRFLIRDVENLN